MQQPDVKCPTAAPVDPSHSGSLRVPAPADGWELPAHRCSPQTAQPHTQQGALAAGFQPRSLQASSFISS